MSARTITICLSSVGSSCIGLPRSLRLLRRRGTSLPPRMTCTHPPQQALPSQQFLQRRTPRDMNALSWGDAWAASSSLVEAGRRIRIDEAFKFCDLLCNGDALVVNAQFIQFVLLIQKRESESILIRGSPRHCTWRRFSTRATSGRN
jgi:hypothetical protein